MPYMIAYEPKPSIYTSTGKTTRIQYLIFLDVLKNGRPERIRLPELARRIRVPYPTLVAVMKDYKIPITVHGCKEHRITTELGLIIAESRRRHAQRKPDRQACEHCRGTGRKLIEPVQAEPDSPEQSGLGSLSTPD